MKIIPERVYSSMQCGASRLSNGSALVVPFLADRLPTDRAPKKWRGFVVPGVLLVPIVAGFYEPRSMYVIALAWLVTAWKLGVCPHCRRSAGSEAELVPDSRGSE